MKKSAGKSIRKALRNRNLAGILDRWNYPAARAKAYEGIDFEALRARIAEIKGNAAGRLTDLAEKFKFAAESHGANVFIASTPEEVKDYIAALCAEKGVETIVKSKSMASEEIRLNEHLAQSGIRSHETDLGEWIIQLAGQTPSHMVMPALHLTREEVAEIFGTEVGRPLPGDIGELVKVARSELREKFFAADLGISGANIAIAETGTIVICTNEGNARLVSTLPKIHVAVVGLEKLVDRFTDAVPILTALPKSATSQPITSYISMITGPAMNDDGSRKELHIILMDNRRTAMADDPAFREALQCIRCGSCLNVCPVFRLVGGHVFGHIYTGGIGTILTAWFNELKVSEDIQALCIGCGKCKEICPGKIDIPRLILEIRRRQASGKGLPLIYHAALAVINSRKVFHTLLRGAYLAQKPFEKDGFIRHLPMFLSGLSQYRSLPAIAPESFAEKFRKIRQPASPEKVAFFAGCAIEFMYPEIGEAVVKVLNKAGIEVIYPEGQSCCGIPHWVSGSFEMATAAAATNLGPLLEKDVGWIVTACATCTTALKKEWPRLLEGKEGLFTDAGKVAAKTVMFSELVCRLTDEKRLVPKEGMERTVVSYHDSCHAVRHVGVRDEPRSVLAAAGYELREMAECDSCCGMGGSYTVKQPEISMEILARKLNNIEKSGAELVSAECPGCLIQISGGLDKSGSRIRAKHPAELLLDRFR